MRKPIEDRIDEILALAAGAIAGALSAKHQSGGGFRSNSFLQQELSSLFSKVINHPEAKKNIKKAIKDVIDTERLNKNWAKMLKKYVKQYARDYK